MSMQDEKMGSIDDYVQGFNHKKLVSEAHDLTPIFSITAPTETGLNLMWIVIASRMANLHTIRLV